MIRYTFTVSLILVVNHKGGIMKLIIAILIEVGIIACPDEVKFYDVFQITQKDDITYEVLIGPKGAPNCFVIIADEIEFKVLPSN